jgi:hypothetical protein
MANRTSRIELTTDPKKSLHPHHRVAEGGTPCRGMANREGSLAADVEDGADRDNAGAKPTQREARTTTETRQGLSGHSVITADL